LNATSSVPSPSKSTKILGGWGFAPDPTGELSWIREPTSKERARGEKGRRREGKEVEGRDFQNWTLTMLETD